MSEEWRFYQQTPTDPIHNPISGEFFSTEAVGDVAAALVRESIQNTLDARKKVKDDARELARVRFYVSEAGGAIPASAAQYWFGSIWPHIEAPRNGLREQPRAGEPCPFLVFEDFGTIGLTGDPNSYQLKSGVTNHFLNFYRAEGHSDKSGHDRGSWGVGKTVFPRASRISSFLGFTVRSDDQRQLLLGRSVLKYHHVAHQAYKSDGYFGRMGPDGLMLPTDDPAVLARFRTDFKVSRQSESGLSIVVPWYSTAGEGGITADAITEAVLRGFYYPILMGHLSVSVGTPYRDQVLDSTTIEQVVAGIGGKTGLDLAPMLQLTQWAQSREPNDFLSLKPSPAGEAPKWVSDLVPHSVASTVREALALRQRLALRIPLTVEPRGGQLPTYFDVFLEPAPDAGRVKTAFIRDELIISDVRSPWIPNARSLVIVEDPPIANLLRDAETPAHTQWNAETGNFKNKYKYGPGVLRFVTHSVSELLRIVRESEQEPDSTITLDFFSHPADPMDPNAKPASGRKPQPAPVGGTPPIPPKPPGGEPRPFTIDKVVGGFTVRGRPSPRKVPFDLYLWVAYDVRRGSPLKRYHVADFEVDKVPVQIVADGGANLKHAGTNHLQVEITDLEFRLEVSGFDTERELFVKAIAKEALGD